MFAIDADEKAGILFLKFAGFWTNDTVNQFVAAVLPVVERLQGQRPTFAILSDATGFPVQSPEVGENFARIMAAGASRGGSHMAVVVSTMLNKIQAQRLFPGANIRIFLDREEALAWLVEVPRAAA